MLSYIFTGGFLAGYRTYIIGFLMILQAVIPWVVGDMSFVELVAKLNEILTGLGLITLRTGMKANP